MAEAVTRYRSIFISDIHLGTKACQADLVLDFLRQTESDHLYLVGDIIDGWRLSKRWYWPQAHNDVIQKLLRRARKGTNVTYHDEFARNFLHMTFGDVKIVNHAIHESATGKRYLVIHGDQFDVVVRHAAWLAHIGDWAYVTLLWMNTWLNRIRRRLGLQYWSLSAYLKAKTKKAVEFVGHYEEALVSEARRRGVDGVICGHIHTAESKMMGDIHYLNDGDWVESCTALVEHMDGTFEVIEWASVVGAKAPKAADVAEPTMGLAPKEAAE